MQNTRKIPIKKNDLSPMGFFFDIFTTPSFDIPLLPIPMRIDRIINLLPTFIIIPEKKILTEAFSKFNRCLDLSKFFYYGIRNYVCFANDKSNEILNTLLEPAQFTRWYNQTRELNACTPDLEEDFAKLIYHFLELFSTIDPNSTSRDNSVYEKYEENMISIVQKRLEENQIKVGQNGKLTSQKIYLTKKGKIFPNIVPVDVEYLIKPQKSKKTQQFFVPYLIYDDLLECHTYNLNLIKESKLPIFDILEWEKLGIIKNVKDCHQKNEDLQRGSLILDTDVKHILDLIEAKKRKISQDVKEVR